MTQRIRQSQFVLTYGPGAILEGPSSSRVIPTADLGMFNHLGASPQQFEISDQRMSQGLLNGARIHRLPSNAELGIEEDRYIYHTQAFPGWFLCQLFRSHPGLYSVLFQGQGRICPVCPPRDPPSKAGAVRFVVACSAGHMDDVNWPSLAHSGRIPCGGAGHYFWHAGGGSLAQIGIECPSCHHREQLGNVYGRDWPCSGRVLEREAGGGAARPGCGVPARLIQKQASNLRIPELLTLFTIPPRYTRLHGLLQLTPMRAGLTTLRATLGSINADQLRLMLQGLVAQHEVRKADADEILSFGWSEAHQAIDDVLAVVPTSYEALVQEEFLALLRATVEGVPPIRGPRPESQVVFAVDPNRVLQFTGRHGTVFKAAPIQTLRTVTVNHGYRREVDTRSPSQVVDISFLPPGAAGPGWYPGVEFLGEGVFLEAEPVAGSQLPLSGLAQDAWINARSNVTYPDYVFRDPLQRNELYPAFVWWHTLAHLILRTISIESGYSSASIRERVYVSRNDAGFRGGILLYASQPGTDGTLGGLIALVPSFESILDVALGSAESCSGDPLCAENKFSAGGFNGAACYACLLLSETSCEHRNMWLDRSVFLENLP